MAEIIDRVYVDHEDGTKECYSVKHNDGKWYNLDGTPYRPRKGYQSPWLLGKGFEANPNNRGGHLKRRKSVGEIIDSMDKHDNAVQALDKKTLLKLYKVLFGTPTRELEKLKNRIDTPLAVAVIIDTLLNPKTRLTAWKEFQTWVFGKAPEAGQMKEVKKDIDFEDMNPEEKEAYETILKKVSNEY